MATTKASVGSKTLIQLVVGDWSGDGHCQTDTVIVESSKSKSETESAFKKGDEKFGLSSYCEEYEDSTVPEKLILQLKDYLPWNFDESLSYEDFSASPEEYADLWIAVARSADPDLELHIVQITRIEIGGYGCYS